MKNKLLPLIFVLGGYSAYSQVGVGTLNPDPSGAFADKWRKIEEAILIKDFCFLYIKIGRSAYSFL